MFCTDFASWVLLIGGAGGVGGLCAVRWQRGPVESHTDVCNSIHALTVEVHAASDDSDVEDSRSRGRHDADDGAASHSQQAASNSGFLARALSGLRITRSASQQPHPYSSSAPGSGATNSPVRPDRRHAGAGPSTSSNPTTSPFTLVNANELQSALRSVASTIDSLRAAGAAPEGVSVSSAPAQSPPPGHSPGVERASSTGGRSRSAGRRDRGARARTADLHSEALSGAVEGCNIYDPQVDPRAYRRVCFCFSFFPCVPRRMGGYSGSLARPGGLLPVASSHCYSPMSTDLTGRSF